MLDRYGMIEALEQRIAPAAITAAQPVLPAKPGFVAAGFGEVLVKAGEVLTTQTAGQGQYLLYVAAGEVIVHATDLNHDGHVDFNDITGLSVGNGTVLVSFVDIHGDVLTDLNPDGTLTDGGKGDVLLNSNIAEIDMRSLTTADFSGLTDQSTGNLTQTVQNDLALSNYSIFGNIYAGGGLGLASTINSGLIIDTTGTTFQQTVFSGATGDDLYQPTTPQIGSIYAGNSATGHNYSFGADGSPTDLIGTIQSFNPGYGQAGASIYNIQSNSSFSIGTIHAGDGGFNGAGGSIVNVALKGNLSGATKLIAGNGGNGGNGQNGGSITNFSDTGAVQGEVLLQSGTGGVGLTGTGGNGGNITLAANTSLQANAHVIVTLGSGGAGYTKGGNGGSIPSGTFGAAESTFTTSLNVVTTMHVNGSVGSSTPFDFNGDGYSDAVFSTTNPDQVVVAFGNSDDFGEFYLDASSYIYLNSPGHVDAIVVGDFTGSGHPDIAVASGSGSSAGVEVFLSEYSATGVFEGFSDPIFSPLPSLAHSGIGFFESSTKIYSIMAGDFTGDGYTDLAVLTTETETVTHSVDSVVMFLQAQTNASHQGTGYFYTPAGGADYLDLSSIFNGWPAATSLFQVTAFQAFTPVPGVHGMSDAIITAQVGGQNFYVITDNHHNTELSGAISFGKVDTNRTPNPNPPGTTNNLSAQPVSVLDLAVVQDSSNPTQADVVALSQTPASFLVVLQGDGTGNFTIATGDNVDQAGAYFGTNTTNPQALVAVPADGGGGIVSNVAVLDYSTGAYRNEIYSFDVVSTPADSSAMPATAATSTATLIPGDVWRTDSPLYGNTAPTGFGLYIPYPTVNQNVYGSGPDQYGFVTAVPLKDALDDQGLAVSNPISVGGYYTFSPASQLGFALTAGNGGDSQSGAGGNGGTLGHALAVSTTSTTTTTTNGTTTSTSTTATGTLSIEFPMYTAYDGTVSLTAGNGGNGFTSGGAGGGINGVSVTYPVGTGELTGEASLVAGNGGQSLTGKGGNGGSMSELYITTGDYFVAGNGGIGVIGGSGGTLYGNNIAGLPTSGTNSLNSDLILKAGDGANGLTAGGQGGGISSFVNEFLALIGGTGGQLNYTAGNGGNAVGGQGGNGGSIVNSSPFAGNDNLAGDILLQGGSGGSGLHGGNGGGVTNFVQGSTSDAIPTSSTILSGNGGNATIGTGGSGGAISNVKVTADGDGTLTIYNFANANLSNPYDSFTQSYTISYNRMVAGAGGSSVGGAGGHGGSISSVDTDSVATDSQNVVVAGAGGNGLTAGGAGGNVSSTNIEAGSASGSGKVVVIAGDGGSSASAKPSNGSTLLDTLENVAYSLGGVDGPGGAGGSISNFTQPGSTSTDVDLIAGNGGATLYHSVAAGNATKDNSGVGGSITNIYVQGSIGNCDADVAIKSYNNLLAGQTMQDFVDSYILGNPSGSMNDTIGNVGLVAGAAGNVEGNLYSSNGVNGSVNNVHAQNIMSMIAGNVDQVQAIQSLTNYGSTISSGGGILGANKHVYYNPTTGMDQTVVDGVDLTLTSQTSPGNYIAANGTYSHTPLPGGGELIDGAFVAKNNRNTEDSSRDFNGAV